MDVSIQAQVINLFKSLQKKLGLTYIFIAHDLAVVRYIADVIGVMYLGHIVEIMDAGEIYSNPVHPYTKALLSAVPTTAYYEEQKRQRILLEGEVPSPDSCTHRLPVPSSMPLCKGMLQNNDAQVKGHWRRPSGGLLFERFQLQLIMQTKGKRLTFQRFPFFLLG